MCRRLKRSWQSCANTVKVTWPIFWMEYQVRICTFSTRIEIYYSFIDSVILFEKFPLISFSSSVWDLGVRSHPFMTSTRRGEGVMLRWTHVDGGKGGDFFVDVINGWPLTLDAEHISYLAHCFYFLL